MKIVLFFSFSIILMNFLLSLCLSRTPLSSFFVGLIFIFFYLFFKFQKSSFLNKGLFFIFLVFMDIYYSFYLGSFFIYGLFVYSFQFVPSFFYRFYWGKFWGLFTLVYGFFLYRSFLNLIFCSCFELFLSDFYIALFCSFIGAVVWNFIKKY